MGLGKFTNFLPFWAVSTDRTELGRIRPSKSGGWGGRGNPRPPRTIAPRRDALLGERNLGCLGEFLAQKVEATGLCMENPLWPGQLDM